MTQDKLIAALRRQDNALYVQQGLCKAAADEIERLQERIEALKEQEMDAYYDWLDGAERS